MTPGTRTSGRPAQPSGYRISAGVAAGTFYLHFSDKRELFRELALDAIAVLRSDLESATLGAPDQAAAVRARFDQAWAGATVAIEASCFCRQGG